MFIERFKIFIMKLSIPCQILSFKDIDHINHCSDQTRSIEQKVTQVTDQGRKFKFDLFRLFGQLLGLEKKKDISILRLRYNLIKNFRKHN